MRNVSIWSVAGALTGACLILLVNHLTPSFRRRLASGNSQFHNTTLGLKSQVYTTIKTWNLLKERVKEPTHFRNSAQFSTNATEDKVHGEEVESDWLTEYNGRVFSKTAKVLWTKDDLLSLPSDFDVTARFPKCFIIGARKAGTSAVQHFMRSHPQIWTRYWEDGFFSREDFYPKGLRQWLSAVPSNSSQVNMMKIAEYFHASSKVPPRIWAMNERTKFIAIVTDPVKRTVSDYLFLKRYTKQPDNLEKQHSFEELSLLENGEVNVAWGCIQRSLYEKHLKNWLQWFPRSSILIINGDEFIKQNPAKQLQLVEGFLGLDAHFKEDDFYFNNTKGFYCYKEGCMGQGKGHNEFTLNPDTEVKLRKFFAPYNKAFSELTGQVFDWK